SATEQERSAATNLADVARLVSLRTTAFFFWFVVNVPPERLQGKLVSPLKQGESGLVRFPLEMLSHFSPLFSARQKNGAGYFAICGRRQGAARPLTLGSIF
ncbi:MAG: hypothetical protein ACI4JQ_07210, partial [Ruminococcus sp.]